MCALFRRGAPPIARRDLGAVRAAIELAAFFEHGRVVGDLSAAVCAIRMRQMCSPSLTSLFRRASLHLKCHLSRFGTRSAPTVVEEKEKEEENTEEVLLPLSQPLSSRA